jgi:hypothetical protein
MSQIHGTQSVSAHTAYAPSFGSAPSSSPPVMPEPQSMDSIGGDPMAALYALLSKQRDNDMASGKANVDHNRELEKAQQADQAKALKEQEEAQENAAKWGIFAKIASVVAIAVSAVASVCSCGAASALCAAACVLSAMAFAEGQTQVLTKLTGNPDVDKAFQIGCGIGAALCSGGAGIANLAAGATATVLGTLGSSGQVASASCQIGQEALGAVNDKGFQDAAMAFGIAGSVCAVAGSVGGAGSAAQGAADTGEKAAKATADVVKGATEIGAGVTTIVSSQFQADATDRGADAKEAELQIAHLQQLTEFVIDGIKESDHSHNRALRTLEGAMQTKAQTLLIASARV